MQFTVPQFIERETKILGPMTFKQTLFLSGVIGIIAFIYFVAPFLIFIIAGVLLAIAGVLLAFFQFSGRPLPIVITNIFKFLLESKIYLWKRKEQQIISYKKQEKPALEEEVKEELPLKIAGKSRLKKLHAKIEAQTK